MAVAGVLAGLLIGVLQPAWYWAIALAVLCVVTVLGAIIWWESRAEPGAAPDRGRHSSSARQDAPSGGPGR